MAEFVTLEQANEHLRAGIEIDSPLTGEGARLELKLDGAEAAVLGFLKVSLDDSPAYDPEGAELAAVQNAILIVLSSMWDDESSTILAGLMRGDPNNPAVALLYPYRDPAIA